MVVLPWLQIFCTLWGWFFAVDFLYIFRSFQAFVSSHIRFNNTLLNTVFQFKEIPAFLYNISVDFKSDICELHSFLLLFNNILNQSSCWYILKRDSQMSVYYSYLFFCLLSCWIVPTSEHSKTLWFRKITV